MAIKEIKREWSPCQLDYVKTFLLHSEKDVKDLPKCCVGSKATVSETDNEYFCTESGWKLGSELGSNSAGGGSSAPTEVVIMSETEYAVDGSEVPITTPLSAIPEVGATVKINYNGAEYKSPVVFVPSDGEMPDAIGMGNTDELGLPGGNTDAPFAMVLYSESFYGMYGVIVPLEEVTTITISIVQESSASGGGASGDYIIVADATTLKTTQKWSEIAAAVQSKRNVRLEFQSGIARMVLWPLMYGVSGAEGEFLFYTPGTMYNSPARYRVIPGEDDSIAIIKAGND